MHERNHTSRWSLSRSGDSGRGWEAFASAFAGVLAGIAWVAALVMAAPGCTAVEKVSDQRPRGTFVKVDVEPKDADVFIDGRYRGRADGWVEQMIPVTPGEHRVKLEADGYIVQRFDVEVGTGETATLTVEMERRLEEFE